MSRPDPNPKDWQAAIKRLDEELAKDSQATSTIMNTSTGHQYTNASDLTTLPKHPGPGSTSHYTNRKCRCSECVEAMSRYKKLQRQDTNTRVQELQQTIQQLEAVNQALRVQFHECAKRHGGERLQKP